MSRDWMETLYPASYAGVPFWVERDNGTTGRRLQVSELPGDDDPFIEDLGRVARDFDLEIYTIGDSADSQMDAVEQVCGMEGPNMLVLPAQGPVQVHCQSFRRSRMKTQMGKFTATLKFVRAPDDGEPTSALWLAQLAFNAGDDVVSAGDDFLNAGLSF